MLFLVEGQCVFLAKDIASSGRKTLRRLGVNHFFEHPFIHSFIHSFIVLGEQQCVLWANTTAPSDEKYSVA